jgi:hypothetical protein
MGAVAPLASVPRVQVTVERRDVQAAAEGGADDG